MKYKLVIFDLDGTLMDTSEGIIASIRHVLGVYGFSVQSDDDLRRYIGPPIQDTFLKMTGNPKLAMEMAKLFRQRYSTVDLMKACPYEGIFQLLQELKKTNIDAAVATYKREDYALKLLSNYGFDKYMRCEFGSDVEGKLSKVDIIRKCVDFCSTSAGDVLMVGDSKSDAAGALATGIDFLGVTYGFGFKTSEDVYAYPCCVAYADEPYSIEKYVLQGVFT